MTRALVLSALTLLAGCTEQVAACETPGEVFDGERCVPRPDMDASASDASIDAGIDVRPDAGPCGGCGAGLHCRTSDEMCVQCLGNEHCGPAEPTCQAGVCVSGCDESICGAFAETPRCGPAGGCVECLPASEALDCDDRSCDPTTNECTTTRIGSVDRCGRCASSSECGTFDAGGALLPMACALTPWTGGDAGYFCVVDHTAAGSGVVCPRGTPRLENGVATREGGSSSFCLPVAETTCPALVDNDACDPTDDCGLAGADDGMCFMTMCESYCNESAGDRGCPGTQSCALVTTPTGAMVRVCTG